MIASETISAIPRHQGILPLVSVIIPMWNEERFIQRCLDCVTGGDYPADRLEILIADGGSTDRSREIVQSYARPGLKIELLDNPERYVPNALNVCLQRATGEIVVRIDAHAEYPPNYVSECVTVLLSSDAECVGGVQEPIASNFMTRAICLALGSWFGSGGARYRVSTESEYADTVWLGCWRRETLLRHGGYNTSTRINEDYELAYRIRKSGGKVLLSSRIRGQYHPRPSLTALSRQYFRYGFWKAKVMLMHPESIRSRQLIPSAFALAIVASAFLGPWSTWPFISLLSFYCVALFLAAVKTVGAKNLQYLPIMPLIFAIIQLSWGYGALVGLLRWKLLPEPSPRRAT